MKAAVLVNPFAGGADAKETICSASTAFFRIALYSRRSSSARAGSRYSACERRRRDYRDRLFSTVDKLAAQEPDFYLVAGGDGFAAYAADRLLKTGHKNPKIVGVAMGTANVGPIVSFSADAMIGAQPEQLFFSDCGAIEAFDGERSLAFGFNDIVLGKHHSRHRGRQAAAYQRARYGAGRQKTAGSAACADRAQPHCYEKRPAFERPAGARFADCRFRRRARTPLRSRGYRYALLYLLAAGARGAALFGAAARGGRLRPRGFETPALCAQMVFGEEDEVTLSGLVPEARVIADGNPYLRSFESVTLRYRPGVIQTANLVK
jgi:hypothetical protein